MNRNLFVHVRKLWIWFYLQ